MSSTDNAPGDGGPRWTADDRPRDWFRLARDTGRLRAGCPVRVVAYVINPPDGLHDVTVQDPIGNLHSLPDDALSWDNVIRA